MSEYKTFAIWGAGNIGGLIAANLIERKVSVTVLSRPTSTTTSSNLELAAKGANIQAYDVEGPDAVTGLKGIDALISTVGFHSLGLQLKLITAAAQAGVRLFVPAEFGDTPTDDKTDQLSKLKLDARKQAAELGLPTAAYFTGMWTEWVLHLGFDVKARKITINGDGEAELSMTSIVDAADFVAYTLVELPREQLENAQFTLEGERISFNALAKAFQENSEGGFEITHISRAALESRFESGDALAGVWLVRDAGLGAHPNPTSHDVYPGFEPRKAFETLRPLLSGM